MLGLAAVIALLPYLSERAVQRAESLDSRAGEAADSGNALGAATMRESALVELDLARGFEPVSYTALLDQAQIQVELGRTADALATLKRAIRLEPYTTDAWLQRAADRAGPRPEGEGLRDAALHVLDLGVLPRRPERCGRGRVPDRLMPRPRSSQLT